MGTASESALTTLVVVLAAAVPLSIVALGPTETTTTVRSDSDAVGTEEEASGGDVTVGMPGASEIPVADGEAPGGHRGGGTEPAAGTPATTGPRLPGTDPRPGLSCSQDANGGVTDTGVTATSIKLAATVVDDGPGASFLAPVRTGMIAVANKANRAGGICGRQIELILRNDSWEAQRGRDFIQRFVEQEKVFALAVVPSSEGLLAADSYIAEKQIPVVGTDGMLIHQYQNPWIWPVATSTISTMHVMAKNAHDRGAENFAIVFDAKYHFGVEGAFAFNEAVRRLTGNEIPGFDPSLKSCEQRFCGIQPAKSSYTPENTRFNQSCNSGGSTCDFVAILLEPNTAETWFSNDSRIADPRYGFGGAQPLFNRGFAEGCRTACDGMWVWSGYAPPIEQLAGTVAAQTYVDDVRGESSSADVTNQFLEGGYVGMSLMMEALRQVGPDLTRARLRAVLDGMTFDSGLTQPLSWSPGNHFANISAHAFSIQYGQSFNGWRQETPFLQDPWVGQDIPPAP